MNFKLGKVKYNFSDTVVVITGGARGQGFQFANDFASAGAQVVVIDRISPKVPGIPYSMCSNEDFAKAENVFKKYTPKPELLDSDVTNFKKLSESFNQIVSNYGKIDTVICNAGVNAVATTEDSTEETWNSIVDTNYKGVYYSCKLASNHMKDTGGGSIINISSLTGVLGVSKQSIYSSTKAAVAGLTRALASEYGPFNIRVNSISPSLVLTPQFVGLNKDRKISLKNFNSFEYLLPNFVILKPHDTAQLVLWLASEGSRFITGQNIIIDAGKSIK